MLRTIHESWTLTAVGGEVPEALLGTVVSATVPGCVHTDLLAAGLIPDPYLDLNELAVAWVGFVDWRYETVLDVSSAELPARDSRLDLVAAGLDTLATIEINGHVVGRTANQHRTYRFDLRGLVHEGPNKLTITFAAAMPYVDRSWAANGRRPHVNAHPFAELRKMACNFGWDWNADLVTAGIWRSISLHSWHGARIASVRPLADVRNGGPTLTVHVEVERAAARGPLHIGISSAVASGSVVLPIGQSSGSERLAAPAAQLWWPVGYGDQPLYDVGVVLGDESGPLDTWRGRVGFRSARLDTSEDEYGTSFTLEINGLPVFARGLNWVPGDSFPARLTRSDYESLLRKTIEIGANLLRVWGGGIYESADFYSLCDELGLLVWQDFALACAAYSEDEPLRTEFVAEARDNVARLSGHPSLAIWNGGNENIWGFEDWGWQEQLEGRSWGNGYYEDIFPAILAELDGTRPYSPGSPYSFRDGVHPNDPSHGCVHFWEVWNRIDYTHYATYSPRFVSEFGYQGPPAWATLTRAIHDDPLTNNSPGMMLHQKAENGDQKLTRGAAPHLPATSNFDDWHWAMSLIQARAIRFGIEHFRSQSPVCAGTIVWQLNDTWPVTSWAAIDGDGRRKPLFYAIQAAYRQRLLTFSPVGDALQLRAVNDSSEPWIETIHVATRGADGIVLSATEIEVNIDPRQTKHIELAGGLRPVNGSEGAVVISADGENGRATRWYIEDVDNLLPDADLDATVERVPAGYAVHITARSLLRDLAILADKVAPDAVTDAMLLTLFPGERARILVSTTAHLNPADLTAPHVLRNANQLVTAARTAAKAEARHTPTPHRS